MSGIGPIDSQASIHPALRARSNAPTTGPVTPDNIQGGDEVEISQHGQLLSLLKTMPEIRIEKVAAARESIAQGDYESDDIVDQTIEALLDDLRDE